MIKIVFFDFGNVLVTYDKVFTKVCHDFNLNHKEFMDYHSSFDELLTIGKIKTDEFWKKCMEHYNLDLEKARQYNFASAWVSDYEKIQATVTLINEISKKIEIGIISNICSEIWESALRDSWVPNVNYKSIILSYKVGLIKPNRDIYELAQKESGVNPNEILFIDDKEKNLIEPKKLGWKTINFNPAEAEKSIEEIRKLIAD
jgi:FMN phosphatase YigB (HAD superfamily)